MIGIYIHIMRVKEIPLLLKEQVLKESQREAKPFFYYNLSLSSKGGLKGGEASLM